MEKSQRITRAHTTKPRRLGLRRRRAKTLVKAMETEEIDRYEDTEDEDVSSDEDGTSTFGFAMVVKGIKPKASPPIAHEAPKLTSRVAPLMTLDPTDDDSIPDGDMLDRSNGWAHRVHVKGTNASQARARPDNSIVSHRRTLPSTSVISSEKDLDRALQELPELMSAMPMDRKKIIKGSKNLPDMRCSVMDNVRR